MAGFSNPHRGIQTDMTRKPHPSEITDEDRKIVSAMWTLAKIQDDQGKLEFKATAVVNDSKYTLNSLRWIRRSPDLAVLGCEEAKIYGTHVLAHTVFYNNKGDFHRAHLLQKVHNAEGMWCHVAWAETTSPTLCPETRAALKRVLEEA